MKIDTTTTDCTIFIIRGLWQCTKYKNDTLPIIYNLLLSGKTFA